MKVIIAPSKTMKYKNYNFDPSDQIFAKETQYLASLLQQFNDEEIATLMKISSKQALQVYDYYHQDQEKHPAISFYQGTVFKQLELDHYQPHLDYLASHVRIMSAYYGVLQYNTNIAPYRLDMLMKPNQMNLYEYWYTAIYQYFEDEDFIISLASKEFTDMIKHPHRYFIDFIEMKEGKPKRNAMIVKKARGQMLNQMILNEVKTLDQLKQLNIDGFVYDETYGTASSLAFVKK